MKNPLKPKISLFILICTLLASAIFVGIASAQSSSNTIVRAEASTNQPKIGETLTVTIKISNVQNLAGIDANLQWNPSVLSLTNVALSLGVESYPNGVLHGNKLNYDYNTLESGDIYLAEEKLSGSYNLLAQSIGQATAAFSGSGTIATLTFNVTNTGASNFVLETELADHPAPGENANFIAHTDTADAVDAVIPEFQDLTILIVFMVIAAAALVVYKKTKKA